MSIYMIMPLEIAFGQKLFTETESFGSSAALGKAAKQYGPRRYPVG